MSPRRRIRLGLRARWERESGQLGLPLGLGLDLDSTGKAIAKKRNHPLVSSSSRAAAVTAATTTHAACGDLSLQLLEDALPPPPPCFPFPSVHTLSDDSTMNSGSFGRKRIRAKAAGSANPFCSYKSSSNLDPAAAANCSWPCVATSCPAWPCAGSSS